MSNDLGSEFIKTARAYFSKEDIETVIRDIAQWKPAAYPSFSQVFQADEEPKIEIAFISGNKLLVDYGLQKSKKEITIMDISKINGVSMRDTKDTTLVYVYGNGTLFLTYTSNTDVFRDSLKRFFFGLNDLLGK